MIERLRARIVVTGSELARGGRRDANGPFLAGELSRRGLAPEQISVVGDAPAALERVLGEALTADLCLVSGGLGPTHDDRTVELLARLIGRELVVDPELEQQIEAASRRVAERLGRPYADFAAGVRKQATLPAGALSLGFVGTAPGIVLEHGGRVVVALPGPPAELAPLWERAVETATVGQVLARAGAPTHRVLRLFGPSESSVARVLGEGVEQEGLEVTICARELEIHVELISEGEAAEQAARQLELTLREQLRGALFAEDERSVEELVLAQCRAAGLTLATAESCTGGLLAARLTAIPGASDVYRGGVVAYADDVKQRRLGVPLDLLERHGAVSAPCARSMAAGVLAAIGSDVAVAVTGVAGPEGGSAEKPVGLVFIHVLTPLGESALRRELAGDRETIRTRAAALAFHELRCLLAPTRDSSVTVRDRSV